MSFDVDWDIEKYRDDHESEDHWQLRRSFMEKWKKDYPEERLVCLARVFTNVELLGCRYPPEVMQEISRLSFEVAQPYRKLKKTMLQRTFVSASDAAEDRAKGIKRQGGIVIDDQPKAPKIQFVTAGQSNDNNKSGSESDNDVMETNDLNANNDSNKNNIKDETINEKKFDTDKYMNEMLKLDCINVRSFRDHMFKSAFGRMVLLIRPWAGKLWNIQTSCQVCNIDLNSSYENRCFTLTINGQIIAQASGDSKVEARSIVENLAWEIAFSQCVYPGGDYLRAFAPSCGALGGSGLAYGAGVGAGLGNGCAGAGLSAARIEVAPTSGGGLPVTSASAIAPTGISVASENAYEGCLTVVGELPFISAVALEGVLPSAGAGVVSYGCGNGVTAITSDYGNSAGAIGIGSAGINSAAIGYGSGLAGISPVAAGYGIGRGCGCGLY